MTTHRTDLEEAEHRIIGQTRDQAIAEIGTDRYNQLITVFAEAHKNDPGTIGNPLVLDDLPGMWEAADFTGGRTDTEPANHPDVCGKCGKTTEDGIFVVVCRHVLEDDFDEDDDGERVPRIHVYAAPASKPGATLHLCREADCPETELCSPCATNL